MIIHWSLILNRLNFIYLSIVSHNKLHQWQYRQEDLHITFWNDSYSAFFLGFIDISNNLKYHIDYTIIYSVIPMACAMYLLYTFDVPILCTSMQTLWQLYNKVISSKMQIIFGSLRSDVVDIYVLRNYHHVSHNALGDVNRNLWIRSCHVATV